MTIIKRVGLGRPLEWSELDGNFDQVGESTIAAQQAASLASAAQQSAATSATDAAASASEASSQAAAASVLRADLASTDAGKGLSLSVAEDGTTGQQFYEKADKFAGAYEDGIITVNSVNSWITYNGERWYVKPGTTVPFTTTGLNATSWASDSAKFLSGGDASLRKELSDVDGYKLLGSVSSFELLRSTIPESVGQIIRLQSYNYTSSWNIENPEYTGGGLFQAVAASAIDDNGTKAVVSDSWYWQRIIENGYLTPQMFGGSADFDVSTSTGTDNAKPFQDSVDSAITYGNLFVFAPAGNYLSTAETNLSGTNYKTGVDANGNITRNTWGSVLRGAKFKGAGMDATNIVFSAASEDSSCFAIRLGWGTSSGRGVEDLTVVPLVAAPDSSADAASPVGNAVELQGCCYSVIRNVRAYQMKRLVWLYNKEVNDFTEYNLMENCFSDRCAIGGDYYVSLGNNSFHANKWINCMIGVRHFGGITIRGYDDQSRGSGSTNYTYLAYIYNNVFDLSIYGAAATTQGNHYAFHLTRAVVENAAGDIEAEGILLFHANDWEWMRSEGSFQSIGATTFESGGTVDTSKAPVNFAFSNISPAVAVPGTDSVLNTSNLLVQVPDKTMKNITGQRITLRVRGKTLSGSTTESTMFVNPAGDNLGFLFCKAISDTSALGDVQTLYNILPDGTGFHCPASAYVAIKNSVGGINVAGYTVAPLKDDSGNVGSASLRFSNGYFASDILVGGYSVTRIGATVPTSATSAGIKGQIATDSTYVYICTATNTWIKLPISAW